MIVVPLSQDFGAVIDDEDLPLVEGYKWYVGKRGSKKNPLYYAVTNSPQVNYVRQKIYMHRIIAGAEESEEVDHRNGNGLDNRRENIRIATKSQQMANRACCGLSEFRGVSRANDKWRVDVIKDGTVHYRAFFDNEIDAAIAYDKAAMGVHGDYARLNF